MGAGTLVSKKDTYPLLYNIITVNSITVVATVAAVEDRQAGSSASTCSVQCKFIKKHVADIDKGVKGHIKRGALLQI